MKNAFKHAWNYKEVIMHLLYVQYSVIDMAIPAGVRPVRRHRASVFQGPELQSCSPSNLLILSKFLASSQVSQIPKRKHRFQPRSTSSTFIFDFYSPNLDQCLASQHGWLGYTCQREAMSPSVVRPWAVDIRSRTCCSWPGAGPLYLTCWAKGSKCCAGLLVASSFGKLTT